MKKNDIILILILMFVGIILFLGMTFYAKYTFSGNIYAKVFYKDELILMIDLQSNEYKIYDTIYKNQIDTGLASSGIFYVPGSLTNDMSELYLTDSYAKDNQIVGIKLQVSDSKISVTYQESPKDICELQNPTNSSLYPIVCLPNELLVSIYTNLVSDEFVPDAILE
jgi:hypothetical protein